LLFTTGLLISPETSLATFAGDTAVIATDNDASLLHKLQANLLAIQSWLTKWRMKANGSRSAHFIFTTEEECVPWFTSTMLNCLT
jgi:hypothetical protein